jgi:hypothetical protein
VAHYQVSQSRGEEPGRLVKGNSVDVGGELTCVKAAISADTFSREGASKCRPLSISTSKANKARD